ncbi:MAG TPA: condensation domain-containing protein [Candidatus Angelobacter sp.]|nr:condensation domain-containing protein [Candidatus Angelobacter sp.]
MSTEQNAAMVPVSSATTGLEVAIIGMAGKFSGSRNLNEFWNNLLQGIETISFFSDEELLASGVSPQDLKHPNYVKARGVLQAPEEFDAEFFSVIAKEAEIMDPQHRVFLECAWEAFEDAGYVPDEIPGSAGVFAGVAVSTYFFSHVLPQAGSSALSDFVAFMSNDKDFLPTRVSYKLNLKGPSIAVSTACSSSLVATHFACKSLLAGECDIALAGGASIPFPAKAGYWFHDGGIFSPDGHCRSFDEQARGSVSGSGVGAVVLKRLEDAMADGDHIYAVIKGSAINNDGSRKIGFTAPSVDGQAEAIRLAQLMAEVDPETISYVETHGSGTTLGDPIEVRALAEAFRQSTQKKQFCAIGSVKTNIGHAAEAAGIAGLIKTCLSLKHHKLPPSLHFSKPNPKLDLENSAFYVNHTLQDWRQDSAPLRAGISSFGIGGTNAHAILEEAPEILNGSVSRSHQLLTLSARSATALQATAERLRAHLENHRDLDIADVAFTCHVGRKAFEHRREILCKTVDDALQALSGWDQTEGSARIAASANVPNVVMMFSGVGSHYPGMAAELYESEPVFRQAIDRCLELLKGEDTQGLRSFLLDRQQASPGESSAKPAIDFRRMLSRSKSSPAALQSERAGLVQAAMFIIDFALAQLWIHWGLQPKALLGYSIGEFTAACIAEVFSLEDALEIVVRRGHLIDSLPPGAMLAVPLPEKDLLNFIGSNSSVAAVNGPSLSVVAGPTAAIEALQRELKNQGIDSRRVQSTHAFHSRMMEPIAAQFTEMMRQFQLSPPKIPYLSNVTGDWITGEQATSPEFWAKHLYSTVRFGDIVTNVCDDGARILLEVGPGQTLCSLTLQHPAGRKDAERIVLKSMSSQYENDSDTSVLLSTLGKLWTVGWNPNWQAFHDGERRRRVSLPTYPFERKVYRLQPKAEINAVEAAQPTPAQCRPNYANRATPSQPYNELQGRILEIWRELLGVEEIGLRDNFFKLGGDSLRATQLVSRLSMKLGVSVRLRKVFENPTVAQLAEVIAQTPVTNPGDGKTDGAGTRSSFRRGKKVRELVSILAEQMESESGRQVEDIYPLTHLQEGILFHVLTNPNSTLYLNQQSYTFKGRIAVPELKQAFQQVVARHPILRTGFTPGDENGPLQIVYRDVELPWQEHDWRGMAPEEQEERTDALLHADRKKGFDLEQPPLTRVTILQLEEDVYRIVWSFHLILLDGWSVALLVEEVLAQYDAIRIGAPIQLASPVAYGDYVDWLHGQDLEEAQNFWRQRLAGLTTPTLLGHDSVFSETSGLEESHQERILRLCPTTTAALQSFAREYELTLNTLIQGAWAFQLACRSGMDDVVFGSVVSGRQVDFPGVASMVGLFINTLPVRVRVAEDISVTDWLKELQFDQVEARTYETSSLTNIQRCSSVPNGQPLFESVVIFQNLPAVRLSAPEREMAVIEARSFERNNYPISLVVVPDVQLTIKLAYNSARFSELTISRVMDQLQSILLQMVADPEKPVGMLRANTSQENARLMEHFNQSLEVC